MAHGLATTDSGQVADSALPYRDGNHEWKGAIMPSLRMSAAATVIAVGAIAT
jgi:hypothetical protein